MNNIYLHIFQFYIPQKDIGIIIDENKISNGEIFISYINEDVLTGIAFISIDPNKNIVINKIYYDDIPSFYKLLNHIKIQIS